MTYGDRLDLFYAALDKTDATYRSFEFASEHFDSTVYYWRQLEMYSLAIDHLIREAIDCNLHFIDEYLVDAERRFGPLEKGARSSAHACPIARTCKGYTRIDYKNGMVMIHGAGSSRYPDEATHDGWQKDPMLARFLHRFDRGYYPQLIDTRP